MRVQEFGMLITIFYWEAGSDIKKEKVCDRSLIFQSTQVSVENTDATKYQMIKLPPP